MSRTARRRATLVRQPSETPRRPDGLWWKQDPDDAPDRRKRAAAWRERLAASSKPPKTRVRRGKIVAVPPEWRGQTTGKQTIAKRKAVARNKRKDRRRHLPDQRARGHGDTGMSHRTVAVIQARMASTRLPGKALLPLAGKPVIQHVVERVQAAGCFDEVIVATPATADCDPIAEWCRTQWDTGLRCYRPRAPENDVLSRYAATAKWAKADLVCRITADCPLLNSDLVRCVVRAATTSYGWADLTTNVWRRTYPKGWDCEVLAFDALLRLDRMATEQQHREHVTFALYPGAQPNYVNDAGWRVRTVTQEDRNASHVNLCLDTPEDYERLKTIAEQDAAIVAELTQLTEDMGLYEKEK